MQIDRLTTRLQSALATAQSLAVGRDHASVEPLHLLAALLEDGAVGALLASGGVDGQAAGRRCRATHRRIASHWPANGRCQRLAGTRPRAQSCGSRSAAPGRRLRLFGGRARCHGRDRRAPPRRALRDAGFNAERFRQAVDTARQGDTVRDANAEDTRQALQKYTVDITERAEAGKLDPVIGRDEEIRRAVQVLQRRNQEQPGC